MTDSSKKPLSLRWGEWPAWDRYFAHAYAYAAVLPDRMGDFKDRAEVAGAIADAMIVERRKRHAAP